MERLKVTQGEWTIDESQIFQDFTTKGWHFNVISEDDAIISRVRAKEFEEAKSNATLIADAGTTYNKCGKLPSELLEERDKWIEAFQKTCIMDTDILSATSKLKNDYDKALEQNRELIEALGLIRFLCDTVNFSSRNQMREAIESSLEAAEALLTKIENNRP